MGILGNIFKGKPAKPDGKISNLNITVDKRIKLSPGESLEKTYSPKPPKLSLDEQWKLATKQAQEHMKNGRLGLYALDLYSLSEICRKEKRYHDQLETLMRSSYIHLCASEEYASWLQIGEGKFSNFVTPILPPAVIRATGIAMKRLNMDIPAYKKLFRETVKETLTPTHLYGIDGTIEIICLYLSDNPDKAEKKIESGARKYLSAHK